MSAHANDEEHELSEDYSSKRSSIAEQEQGLLGGWKEQDGDGIVRKRRPWSCATSGPRAVWAAVAAAIAVALFVTVYSVVRSRQTTGDEAQETLGIQSNDYLLDPTWDIYASPRRREYTWTVRDQTHNPDGIYRPMMLVNNQFPGPLVEVNEGDTIVVHVDNQAVNATSIHWHGLYQNGTPHMDGTVGITQCPIAPGGKFTYEFTVSGQSGTYWWHAHQGVQSSDGMHGPLIVHSREERQLQQIDYATDRVVLVSDHYHDLSSALLWQYLAPDMENAEPVPEGGLINGRSIRNCDDYPHRECDNTTSNVGLAPFDLAPNQSHRLRIVNVGAFAEFQVQLDEHELAVTEVDGTDVSPINYHRLNINPAQRYSVIVNTSVGTSESFWLRARMITKCFTDPPKTLDAEVRAIVRYTKGSASADERPTSVDWEEQLALACKDMNTTDLTPVQVIAAPAEADAFFYLRSNFEIGAYRLSRGFFDSSSWRPDARSPTLLRAIDGLSENNASFASAAVSEAGKGSAFINDAAFEKSRELVLQTTGIQTIDILVSNYDDGSHPLHVHGYKYFVLAQGHGSPPMVSVLDGMTRDNIQPLYDSLDLSNPLRRDTASVEGFGWILLRLIADNPGAWAFHCHISWHTEAGLLMQFLTRTDELASMSVPEANRALCTAEGIERGMAPDDESYHGLAK
ncbi:hypothetical protein LTR36_002835 [Oleoguttula mirabilis]|uniref:Laccase n=1 Tax=Oleoguttula mirabilis TaxID=1507867 RepID=A0AAV9JJQ5_9PEZI|nr:hypothetical protein LTR36_002835 [Oleoguttula mirabilis]